MHVPERQTPTNMHTDAHTDTSQAAQVPVYIPCPVLAGLHALCKLLGPSLGLWRPKHWTRHPCPACQQPQPFISYTTGVHTASAGLAVLSSAYNGLVQAASLARVCEGIAYTPMVPAHDVKCSSVVPFNNCWTICLIARCLAPPETLCQ